MKEIILFYKFVDIDDPVAIRDWQHGLCSRLDLKGRVLVAKEGINGTLSGSKEHIDEYIQTMEETEGYEGIDFKRSQHKMHPFPRLSIKARDEIVTLGAGNLDVKKGGEYLSPDEFHEFVNDPEVVILDGRNNYESAVGKFKNAITPDVSSFKEFPELLDEYEDLKDKKVVTYCTGGIRCEKLTVLMKEKGFKDVYQLEGGIVRYGEKYPEGHWEGKCFVFDDRMSVAFKDKYEKLASCHHCNSDASEYQNCQYPPCNKLMVLCNDCLKSEEFCSENCQSQELAKV